MTKTGSWCTVVSDTETYCCGFGARASCISRGLEYSGPSTPCELRLVRDSDGVESCEGLEGSSGNLDEDIDCNCEGKLCVCYVYFLGFVGYKGYPVSGLGWLMLFLAHFFDVSPVLYVRSLRWLHYEYFILIFCFSWWVGGWAKARKPVRHGSFQQEIASISLSSVRVSRPFLPSSSPLRNAHTAACTIHALML